MPVHKLRINPLAKQDLLEIKDYIGNELDNTQAAHNTIIKILKSCEKLKQFPLLGMDLSAKITFATDYRYLISGNYIIFYKLDEVYISIYRIIYARRDYIKILFEEIDLLEDADAR